MKEFILMRLFFVLVPAFSVAGIASMFSTAAAISLGLIVLFTGIVVTTPKPERDFIDTSRVLDIE